MISNIFLLSLPSRGVICAGYGVILFCMPPQKCLPCNGRFENYPPLISTWGAKISTSFLFCLDEYFSNGRSLDGVTLNLSYFFTADVSTGPVAPGKCGYNFKYAISNSFWGFLSRHCHVIVSSGDSNNDFVPTLDRVLAWCRYGTNLYLNQCWPSSEG